MFGLCLVGGEFVSVMLVISMNMSLFRNDTTGDSSSVKKTVCSVWRPEHHEYSYCFVCIFFRFRLTSSLVEPKKWARKNGRVSFVCCLTSDLITVKRCNENQSNANDYSFLLRSSYLVSPRNRIERGHVQQQ